MIQLGARSEVAANLCPSLCLISSHHKDVDVGGKEGKKQKVVQLQGRTAQIAGTVLETHSGEMMLFWQIKKKQKKAQKKPPQKKTGNSLSLYTRLPFAERSGVREKSPTWPRHIDITKLGRVLQFDSQCFP
jgi:hypothetical protein